MSHIHPTSTSSNFQLIFDNALKAYKKRTKNDLLTHQLAVRLEACNSSSSILTVLQELVQELNRSQRSNTKWLDPTVNVLLAFSETLGESVGSVFSPAKTILIGFGVLLSTAKDVHADQDTLFEMFERIESFFRRLDIYTKVAPNQGMADTITAIMVEVLNILAIATKEIKQGRMKKYLKKLIEKLIGNNDVEDALKRLDRLTQEEARMASAQLLEITNTIDNRVGGIADNVLVVDNRVAGIERSWFPNRIHAGHAGSIILTENQLRQDLRRWLSPQDPSTNHNIACNAHHKGTATWFFERRTYKEWKSTGSESLLWVHGKPGSGKSILCSTIIEDVKAMCNAGQASIAYFYFDFRDINKQHWRDLVPSLLTQLSTQSSPCCDILSRLYSSHDNGAQQPNDDALKRCLIDMLTIRDRHPIYLIMDALDECPDTSEVPSPRNRILQLLKELADLQIPNLHICVTSRPEFDIRDFLGPLTSRQVSLHDQSGQKQDIADYVRSVVYSDSEPIMRRWRKEDKEFVIETLSERADGMFRWIFCQLEVLRQCLPPSVRRTLRELPESLDETYERILREIKKPNRDIARRVLQSLVVATRPPRVAELAEVLAVDFDDAEGIPRLNSDWRWEDQEQALLIACSSLIVIVEAGDVKASDKDYGSDSEAETDDGDSRVEAGDSRIVQFSHFSVKEFLTSSRLATASGEVSNYHIGLKPAHTILAQACLGVLLQIQDNVDRHTRKDHPLARYAAKQWATHAQFGEVSSCLHKAMEYLFDTNKPHFKVWLTLCDIDTEPNEGKTFYRFASYPKSPAAPLYYAALCGFHDLVEHLIIKHPQDVNADGGFYVRPIVGALAGEHFRTADLLRHNGADLDLWGSYRSKPLHAAAHSGKFEVVRILIEYDPADINARSGNGSTPLHWASIGDNFNDGSVIRLLLEHGADINAQNQDGRTPLHWASYNWALEVVRLLLEHGADVEAKSNDGKTALQEAADRGYDEIVKLLREHGAK
ncbi:hypothetical protein F5888DRAFT_1908675 [Russula emetica]|nr:hypothetical protein F5888DRAFT_1908675 [Russula emetica]